jgi:hypothetical protein
MFTESRILILLTTGSPRCLCLLDAEHRCTPPHTCHRMWVVRQVVRLRAAAHVCEIGVRPAAKRLPPIPRTRPMPHSPAEALQRPESYTLKAGLLWRRLTRHKRMTSAMSIPSSQVRVAAIRRHGATSSAQSSLRRRSVVMVEGFEHKRKPHGEERNQRVQPHRMA